MRVCRHCQHINGDTDTHCRACGGDIAAQMTLTPDTPVARTIPDLIAGRNRRAMLLLFILPLVVALNVVFWVDVVPGFFAQAGQARAQRLQVNQAMIEHALARCQADTGGVPLRDLAMLQYSRVTAADLTPGAKPHRWRGPYLSQPFPANPYRANDGVQGWRYTSRGQTGIVVPAHISP